MSKTTNSFFPLYRLPILALYFLGILLISNYCIRHPHYNWDMLAYIALAKNIDKTNIEEVHKKTYDETKANIPSNEYSNLIGSEKRALRANDPNKFFELLPFYAVKPLYIQSIKVFNRVGFSSPSSTVIPSVLSFFLISVLLLYWLTRILKLHWAALMGFLMMFSGPMVFAARLSTPDAMSALFLLFSFFFIVIRPSILFVFLSLIFSMTVRLDNIIPAVILLSYLYFSKKPFINLRMPKYLLMMGGFVSTYFLLNVLTLKQFDWGLLYYPKFFQYLNLSGTPKTTFSLNDYLQLVVSQLFSALLYSSLLIFLLILSLILYSPRFSFKKLQLDQQLCFLFLIIILIRFIFYPDLSDRFNLAYYLFFLLTLLKRLSSLNNHVSIN